MKTPERVFFMPRKAVTDMDYFSTSFEIKDIDTKKGIVTGYPATFDVIDDGNDVIEPGAFARTINSWGPNGKNRIKALFMHEPVYLLGKPLVLKEDNYGLYQETQFCMKNSFAKDIFYLIDDGAITEQSIGYDVVKKKLEDGLRRLKELKMYEYSYVVWGMNSETPILSSKSLDDYNPLIKSMERIEKALKKGHFQTDEIPQMLEISLKNWQTQLKAIEKKKKEEAPKKKAEVIVIKKKAKEFEEIYEEQDLRAKGWRLLDAFYTTFWKIIDEGENAATQLETSLEQLKGMMVEWANEAENQEIFSTMREYWSEDPEIQTKCANLTKEGRVLSSQNEELLKETINSLSALLSSADSDNSTQKSKDPQDGEKKAGDSGESHSLEAQEELKKLEELKDSLKELSLFTKKKKYEKELQAFSKSLKGDD